MEEKISESDTNDNFLATVNEKFEEDGTLQQIRCMLQSKIVSEISGIEAGLPLVPRRLGIGADDPRDISLQVLDQLILEVFYWEGYFYTAEMFARECGCENTQPMREGLESLLGTFEQTDEPILLQLIENLKQKE